MLFLLMDMLFHFNNTTFENTSCAGASNRCVFDQIIFRNKNINK